MPDVLKCSQRSVVQAMAQRYDKNQVEAKLLRWEKFLGEFRLPEWEALPRIELYMDQVIALLGEYLGYLAAPEGAENFITPTMVNNYVKQKIIPAPVKKKYGRSHLACLLMLCICKQTLSMAVVRQMLPQGDEADIRRTYETFWEICAHMGTMFTQYVRAEAGEVFDPESDGDAAIDKLRMGAAVTAAHAKLLAVKLSQLQLESGEEQGGRK